MDTDATVWLRRYEVGYEPAIRLICFPHAGGTADFYRPWRDEFGGQVEIVAVQYPGHGDRLAEAALSDLDELADRATGAIEQLLGQPVALFGHSLGALVAYEVARRVARSHPGQPACLLVSAREAPRCAPRTGRHLEDDDTLWTELRGLGGTDETILRSTHWRSLLLPVLRADYRLDETYRYRPGPELDCPVAAYLGDDDAEARADEMTAWGCVTTGGFSLRSFPGGHFYLVPHRAQMTSAIASELAAAGTRASGRYPPGSPHVRRTGRS